MTSKERRPQIPGEPLVSFEPGDGQTEYVRPAATAPSSRRRTTRQALNSRSGPMAAVPSRTRSSAVTPELRLVLAVAAVFFATVVVGQQGSSAVQSTTPTVAVSGTAAESESTDSSVAPVASGLRVLVSDPANTALVREIAGNLLAVDSVVPPGANGHTYEPVPGDAVKVTAADLFIENGLELNPAVSNFVAANSKSTMVTVTLSDVIPKAEVISTDTADQIAAHGHAHSFNAHLWTDPIYAIAYAERISAALSSIDPTNAATYADRTDRFVARLRNLDAAFRAAIDSIPAQNKKLVVYHDSWSYFGRRYGIPIVGAIQPVTFAEPSAEEIRRMIDQIKKENVPAFFGSEVFPSDVLETVANETGATYHSDLSDEELPGEPGTPEHSYEGMMIANVRLITTALGGNPSTLAGIAPGVDAS